MNDNDRFMLTFSIVPKRDGCWLVASIDGEPHYSIGPFPDHASAKRASDDARDMMLSLPGEEDLGKLL